MNEGRPPGPLGTTYFRAEFVEQVEKLCLLGATDAKIADFFEVSEVTLYSWQKRYPPFREAMKRGKLAADGEIAHALFHRAKGYSHKSEKIFCDYKTGEVIRAPTVEHYPPDTGAVALWLHNRQPDVWRNRQEIDHRVKVDASDLTDEELERIARSRRGGDGAAPQAPGAPELPRVVH